ncbi:MAG: DUF6666 family protein [Pirellulales bacterium]
MRFSYLWKRAWPALAANMFCAALALGQRLPDIAEDTTDDSARLISHVWSHADTVGSRANAWSPGGTAWEPEIIESPGESSPRDHTAQQSDPGCCLCPYCQECPRRGVIAFLNYDSWRGIPDGNWQNNGVNAGVNFATRLGRISDLTGIGFQIGGSAGAYNWAGTDYRATHQDDAQAQGFVTYGLFRKANESSGWSGAVVQDWMLNSNYGEFAENPTLSQWRGQAGYAVSAWNEFGIWGTWRARGDTRFISGFGTTSWRPINQLNGYWHYKWGPCASDTWLWIGKPENDRLVGGGSLGDYTVGALAQAPLSNRVALTALITYMHQSASLGPQGAKEDAWNFSIGLSFYPAYNARSRTVAGQCWMPALPVANNGYFLVDTDRVY